MQIDFEKLEKLANEAIARERKETEIYDKYLIPFAYKIGLDKNSKDITIEAQKAIAWDLEKAKYGIKIGMMADALPGMAKPDYYLNIES